MKRYRISHFSIDSTRNFSKNHPAGKSENERRVVEKSIISNFGTFNSKEKLERYMELEKPPFSVVAEHTHLLEDISMSYIHGSLYSALTGACCLGERILNRIILNVRDEFKSSDHYKNIYDNDSFNDWEKVIGILKDWNIIDEDVFKKYSELLQLRNDSVHYQKKDQDLKAMSLAAINAVNFVVNSLFGIASRKDMLIYFEVPGEIFIKKQFETDPIIKAYYIPCSVLVGPRFRVEAGSQIGQFKFIDTEQYEEKEITDSEFVEMRNSLKYKKG